MDPTGSTRDPRSMPDSRATLRYALDLPARMVVGETELCARIANLSLGGVFVIGPLLPTGTRCQLHFRPPGGEPFRTSCVTRWTSSDGCGLAFEGLQPIDAYQLARLIGQAARASDRVPASAHVRPAAR